MMSVSFLIQLFSIASVIRSSFETECGLTKTIQNVPNFRSWQISIVYSNQEDQINPLKCSGTILNDRFVITAAHCLYDLAGDPIPLSMLQIQSANIVGVTRMIKKVYHPKEFNVEKMDDDVALLKLDRPFEFNSYVSPICFDLDKFTNHPETFAFDANILETASEIDLINLMILTNRECNTINSLIFNVTFNNSLCLGQVEASQTYHRKAGAALMKMVNETMFINGVVLYTIGSSQGNISFAGAIDLEPYAVWIDTVINRHISELKCKEYNQSNPDEGINSFAIPSVLLLRESIEIFNPPCYASLISERFLITAARCKSRTEMVFIQYDMSDTEIFNEFKFHTITTEPDGIALVELPRKPRRFTLLITCLWTEADTPIDFVAQIRNVYGSRMQDYFRVKYIPRNPIKLENIKECDIMSLITTKSAPGDIVAMKRNNETLRRIIGLTINGFGNCWDHVVESVVEKLEWIEDIVWG